MYNLPAQKKIPPLNLRSRGVHTLFLLYILLIVPPTPSTAADRSQIITTITADQMSMDNRQHRTVFSGHVLMQQEDTEIKGNTLTIYHHSNKGITDDYAIGGPVTLRITPAQTTASYGYAHTLRITANGNTIVLLGHARLEHGRSVITGERIEYNRVTDTCFVSARPTQAQQMEVVIHPK